MDRSFLDRLSTPRIRKSESDQRLARAGVKIGKVAENNLAGQE
jgi:hypothetical protein